MAYQETKQIMAINITTDYQMFQILEHNRAVNPAHVAKIMQSMKEEHLVSPICVNQDMEIIDGQHRYEASKNLGLPVYYYICENYGHEQVQRLNTNQNNWGIKDFHEHFVSLGKEEYVHLDNFMAAYALPLNVARLFATIKNRRHHRNLVFKTGQFQFTNQNAEKIARRYNAIRNYWDFSEKKSFVIAFLNIIENPLTNWTRLKESIQNHHHRLRVEVNVDEFAKGLNKLYNHGRKDRVRLYEEQL